MNRFDYVRPAHGRRSRRGRLAARRRLSRRRHQPARPDEGRRHPARAARRHHAHLPGLDQIETLPDGGVRIGALVRNADLAHDRGFRPRLSRGRRGAAVRRVGAACATPRPSAATSCSARAAPTSTTSPAPATSASPAAGCDALGGENRLHAVLGWSESCIATHPSDFCVPLVALDAVVEIEGRAGRREIPLEAFHRLPGERRPSARPMLEPGEMIVAVRLPPAAAAFRRACALPEGSRAHVLCLRGRLGRGGAADRGRRDRARRASRSAASR